jgi:hypothetical protein
VILVRDFAERARRMYDRLGFVRSPELDWVVAPDLILLGMRLPL